MKCKYCDAALEEDMTVCPVCGKEQQIPEESVCEKEVERKIEESTEMKPDVEGIAEEVECSDDTVEEDEEEQPAEKEKVKLAWWKLTLMGVGLLAVVILFVALILKSQGVDINPAHWFDKESSQSALDFNYKLKREDYTAAEDDAEGQAAKIVAKSGDIELDNARLQIYYWNGVYEFINQYQYYLESLGLDLTQPFNEQKTVMDTTWQAFFLENAIFNWHKFSALVHEAEEAGFELSADSKELLELTEQDMEEYAQSSGYESAIDMLKAEMGELVTMEAYKQYSEEYYMAMEYFNAEYAKMQPSDDEIVAYFTENEEKLASEGIVKEKQVYDVRHILIEPEGGTEVEGSNVKSYTEEEWAACEAAAQALLDQWKSGDATEESFAELAKTKSTDGGSSENGGLYADLDASTSFVQEFKDWYLDENRKVGDTGLVKSVYGYHIMYFSATETAETDWKEQCSKLIAEERSAEYVDKIMKKWSVKLFDKEIAIGNVILIDE